MASLCEHHRQLSAFGIGKCSVPMWSGFGTPDGFCDKDAYGAYIDGARWRDAWTGQHRRYDGEYAGFVPGLACPMHGGPKTRAFMDGDKWCAVRPDFIDLQASVSGWGDTPEEARADLVRQP
jgi:hypothetical protein